MTMERKHVKQMSPVERAIVETLVHNTLDWSSKTFYLVGRMNERRITRADALQCLRYGNVVELQNVGRVVMRDRTGVCVVADIPARHVVTVWYNAPDDNHYTLDNRLYQWHVDAVSFVQGLQAAMR